MDNSQIIREFIEHLHSIEPVSTDQIPSIDLYMDQVTTFMDNMLSDSRRYETDKVLTKTMINNYAKNHLLPAPVNKKYNKDHILYLIYIYYLKNIISIGDIQTALSCLSDLEKNSLSMEEVYTRIFSNYQEESYRLMKDIVHKMDAANKSFEDVNAAKKEDLQKFSYLCMLAFDIYLKKSLMENIIDDITRSKPEPSKKDKSKK